MNDPADLWDDVRPPTIALALAAVDRVSATATAELNAAIFERDRMARKLDDAETERHNMYPLLRAAEKKNATYAHELMLLTAELDRSRDAEEALLARVDELEDEILTLAAELKAAKTGDAPQQVTL